MEQLKKERDRGATSTIRIERGTGCFRRRVCRQHRNQISPQDVSKGPRQHRSSSESAMGESQGTAKGCSNREAQADYVSIGPSQDRGGSTSEVGEGQAR
jgi:hypothetical protein